MSKPLLFWLIVVVLTAITSLVVAWPFLRRAKRAAAVSTTSTLESSREALRELQRQLKAGEITQQAFDEQKRELASRLLDEPAAGTAVRAAAAVAPKVRWIAAGAMTVFVGGLALALYFTFGNPAALDGQGGSAGAESGSRASAPLTTQQIQKMVDQMNEQVKQNPGDAQAWSMLAHSYDMLQNFTEATKAYARAAELTPNDAQLLADYADSLAMAQGRTLAGEPMKLINKALSIEPNNLKALALAGTDAFDRRDYPTAIKRWEAAIKLSDDPNLSKQLQAGVTEARALANGAVPSSAAGATAAEAATPVAAKPAGVQHVSGRVTLAASLKAMVSPDDTLFIFARPNDGSRMPVALLRKQVRDLPFDFNLDDSMAMMPTATLSNYQTVIVGARISKGGDASPRPGDMQGFSAPVAVGSNGVKIEISDVVK